MEAKFELDNGWTVTATQEAVVISDGADGKMTIGKDDFNLLMQAMQAAGNVLRSR